MAYEFWSSEYKGSPSWKVDQYVGWKDIMAQSVKGQWSSSQTINRLKEAGLSYRRTNMLHDIAYAKAVEQSRDTDAYERAVEWWNTVETVRKERGFTTRAQAINFVERWKEESWDTLEEAEYASELEDRNFGPSP